MKKSLLSATMVLLSVFAFAQESDDYEKDTIENDVKIDISFGRSNFDSTENLTTRWFTFGLGVNTILNDGDFNLPNTGEFFEDWDQRVFNSTNTQIGIVQQKLNLVDHKVNLLWGLGLDNHKYSFEDTFFIDLDSNEWGTTTDNIARDAKKNKLSVTYLELPVMLNFESTTSHYNSFRLSVGGFGGLRIQSNQKIKFRDRDDNLLTDKQIYKERDSFNLNNFVYGLKTEIGFGPVNLYGKYALENMFKDNAAPEVNQFSAGIMIVPF